MLYAAVSLLLLHSALDVLARRAALKYAALCCDREWAASAPVSWLLEAGFSGDAAAMVMGRRGGGPWVLRWASAPGR